MASGGGFGGGGDLATTDKGVAAIRNAIANGDTELYAKVREQIFGPRG